MGRPQEVSREEILTTARKCFITRGVGISAAEIARELGVSHTTLFNRFGSKEALLVAALGVPEKIDWAENLQDGPDDRPIVDQLIEHGILITKYFNHVDSGLTILHAAGISDDKIYSSPKARERPMKAFHALVEWLKSAQAQGKIGECDTDVLASTILGALRAMRLKPRAGRWGDPFSARETKTFVEGFMKLLWSGIAPGAAVSS